MPRAVAADPRGILEDFPRAKIVGSHGGGGIGEVIGRLDHAYEKAA